MPVPLVVAECLPLKPYTTADGFAHNLINKIVRDSRGFLWFCTAEGLSRFDGYSFTNYTTEHGLPHRNVTDFVEAPNGEFWIGRSGGLVRFDPKGTPTQHVIDANDTSQRFAPMFSVVVPRDEDRQAKAINVVLAGRDGTVWCGSMRQLYRLERQNGQFELIRTELKTANGTAPAIYILDLAEDQYGSLWIGGFSWLCRRWPDGSSACYNKSDGLSDHNIHDVLIDRFGRLWVATRLGGFLLLKFDESHSPPVVLHNYTSADGLKTDWVAQIFEASDGRLWIATNKGLAQFLPDAEPRKQFHTYNENNGLIYCGVTSLSEDPDGNLWLGTDAGAMKLARAGFVGYGRQDGLGVVSAIFEDRANEVCFRGSVLGDANFTVFEGAKLDFLHPTERYYSRFGRFDGQHFLWFKPSLINDQNIGWVGEDVSLQSQTGEWWLGTGSKASITVSRITAGSI